MAREPINFQQYLRGPGNILSRLGTYLPTQPTTATATGSSLFRPSVPLPPGYSTTAFASASASVSGSFLEGSGKIIAYIIGIIFVIIVISLLIHYYITPIYSLRPGAPGIILIPGFDDGVLFWNGSGVYPAPTLIKDKDLPIKNKYYDYSFIVDMFIQDPMQFSTCHRILLSRGLTRRSSCTGDTIMSIASSFNFVVALKPDVNDIIVAVSTSGSTVEQIIIENIPVQEPFRLGVIVMQQMLEVYINGLLKSSIAYKQSLQDIKGDINIATGTELTIAKMQNLKIWDRTLSTSEIRYAKPDMASALSFAAGAISSSTSCSPL